MIFFTGEGEGEEEKALKSDLFKVHMKKTKLEDGFVDFGFPMGLVGFSTLDIFDLPVSCEGAITQKQQKT